MQQATFLGVPPGARVFRSMSIDIHTVRDGKLVLAHRVDDWAGAIRQLTQKWRGFESVAQASGAASRRVRADPGTLFRKCARTGRFIATRCRRLR